MIIENVNFFFAVLVSDTIGALHWCNASVVTMSACDVDQEMLWIGFQIRTNKVKCSPNL